MQDSLFDARDILVGGFINRFIDPWIVEFKSEKLLNNADEILCELCANYYELMSADTLFDHIFMLISTIND